jgi:hypothetical protein
MTSFKSGSLSPASISTETYTAGSLASTGFPLGLGRVIF